MLQVYLPAGVLVFLLCIISSLSQNQYSGYHSGQRSPTSASWSFTFLQLNILYFIIRWRTHLWGLFGQRSRSSASSSRWVQAVKSNLFIYFLISHLCLFTKVIVLTQTRTSRPIMTIWHHWTRAPFKVHVGLPYPSTCTSELAKPSYGCPNYFMLFKNPSISYPYVTIHLSF